ncbi:hypothetical protein ACIA5D_49890 [Actinoplanes sp. NPDC051513]|uniref:hypothetical protein n=1 Tax=Actinoplanes sp. NPDC051513 TaxID=3363908 RepID=UPI0037A7CB8C
MFESSDGVEWSDHSADLPDAQILDAATMGAKGAVLLGWTPDNRRIAWTRRPAEKIWNSAKSFDPGRLPDAGVVPVSELNVDAVVALNSGFLALGSSGGPGQPGAVGLLWASAEGLTWTRMPVKPNGFDQAEAFVSAAQHGDQVLLVGIGLTNIGVKLWLGRHE